MSGANSNSILSQGKEFALNNIKKVQNAFKSSGTREGFYGIDSTDADANINILNAGELATLNSKKMLFDKYTTDLSNASMELNKKIKTYARNMSEIPMGVNYNLFTNRLLDTENILVNSSEQCVNNSLLKTTGSGFAIDPAFNDAYPPISQGGGKPDVNFTSFMSAKEACKLWAYDSKKQLFGVTKQTGGGYDCYTSNNAPSTQPAYLYEQVAYTVASSVGGKFGGIFKNGQIGVYNGVEANPNIVFDSSTSSPPYSGYAACDKWSGGKIKPSSITASYGRNCNNLPESIKPRKIRYVMVLPAPGRNIQMSQIAVYAIVKGLSVNVAYYNPNIERPGYKVEYSRYLSTGEQRWNGNLYNLHEMYPVDGVLATRNWEEGVFLSQTTFGGANYWRLDLGREYNVYKVVYYNSSQSPGSTDGAKIQLFGSDLSTLAVQYVLTGDLIQSFDVSTTISPSTTASGVAATYSIINPPNNKRIYSTIFGVARQTDIGSVTTDALTQYHESKSSVSYNPTWNSEINFEGSWIPAANQTTEYIIMDLVNATDVAGVVIQPPYDVVTKFFVTKFKVQYWNTTKLPPTWSYVTVGGNTNSDAVVAEFLGIDFGINNYDTQKKAPFGINTITNTPLTYRTTKIKIIPTGWNIAIAMRAGILVLDVPDTTGALVPSTTVAGGADGAGGSGGTSGTGGTSGSGGLAQTGGGYISYAPNFDGGS